MCRTNSCTSLSHPLFLLYSLSHFTLTTLTLLPLPSQYYTECNEAESWMMDRKPLVASKDYGKDETKAEVLLKKHDAVELDFEGFGATITHLKEKAVMMMERGHFDR